MIVMKTTKLCVYVCGNGIEREKGNNTIDVFNGASFSENNNPQQYCQENFVFSPSSVTLQQYSEGKIKTCLY